MGDGKTWLTPPWLLRLLGRFDLDPCAPRQRPWPTATRHFTIDDDGLLKPWSGRVLLNPPFGGGIHKWFARMAAHRNGTAILPLRSTDAKWFTAYIWQAASAMLFLAGRVKFYKPDGTEGGSCPHATMIVAHGADNARRLLEATNSHHDIRRRAKYVSLVDKRAP